MSALYGRLQGGRGEVTRTGHYQITSKLETWEGKLETTLYRDGSFEVRLGEKYSSGKLVLSDNVDEGRCSGQRYLGVETGVETEVRA